MNDIFAPCVGGVHGHFDSVEPIQRHEIGIMAQHVKKVSVKNVAFVHVVGTAEMIDPRHGFRRWRRSVVQVLMQFFQNVVAQDRTYPFFVVANVLVQLQEIDHTANVRSKDHLNRINGGAADGHIFVGGDFPDELVNVVFGQLIESHTDELVLQSSVNLANIVANQTEAYIHRGGLQEIFERMLGIARHVIDFVENDKLETLVKEVERPDKRMNLIADNVNAAFVGSVEMNDVALVGSSIMFGLELVDQVDDGGGLARTRWAIKEQVGEILLVDDFAKEVAVRGVENNVIELRRTVFLDPGFRFFGGHL